MKHRLTFLQGAILAAVARREDKSWVEETWLERELELPWKTIHPACERLRENGYLKRAGHYVTAELTEEGREALAEARHALRPTSKQLFHVLEATMCRWNEVLEATMYRWNERKGDDEHV